jgi:hypothetical protein
MGNIRKAPADAGGYGDTPTSVGRARSAVRAHQVAEKHGELRLQFRFAELLDFVAGDELRGHDLSPSSVGRDQLTALMEEIRSARIEYGVSRRDATQCPKRSLTQDEPMPS